MADASSLANSTRLSLGPVQVKSIGETGVVSTGSQRREVQLSMDGRSALLTLWGKETDLEVLAGDMYIVRNKVSSNDFNKQRCYSSTPLTKFEIKCIHCLVTIVFAIKKVIVISIHRDKSIASKLNEFYLV
nr:uncharacterized protein LOC117686014 [Crassostrea gigas]